MHELFEHTADLGLRAHAADLNTLFAEAARCLISAIVEDPQSVRPLLEQSIAIGGDDRELLLFDFLRELLYRFDADHMLFCDFVVTVRPDGLTATVRGEPREPARHVLSHEVKAITYHGLIVQATEHGWLAEVIVDI